MAADGGRDHRRGPDHQDIHGRCDRSAEPTENFAVNLSAPTNGLIVDSQGVGTIVDDEPRISISDVTKAEGKTGHTFTVTLSAAS